MRILRIFKSKSNFFREEKYILLRKRDQMVQLLEVKGYAYNQIQIYIRAYNYMMDYPWHFDGATMTEDLCDIPGLDTDAMLHDYLYIRFNAAGNYPYIWKADKLIRSEMRRKGKSTINAGLRFVLLLLKTFIIPFPLYARYIKKRRVKDSDAQQMDQIFEMLNTGTPRSWFVEYRGEIEVTILIIIFFLVMIN